MLLLRRRRLLDLAVQRSGQRDTVSLADRVALRSGQRSTVADRVALRSGQRDPVADWVALRMLVRLAIARPFEGIM
jgi:hypothetical protein